MSEPTDALLDKIEKDAQETTVLKKEIKEEPVDNIARPGEHLITSQRSSELMENEQCEKTEDAGEHLIISQRSSENVQYEKAKDAGDGSAYVEPPAHSTAPQSSEEASVNTTDQPELIEATADMQPANAIHRCPTCNDEFSSSSELMFHEERHRSGGSDRTNSVPNNSTQATISTANEEAISNATASDPEGNRNSEQELESDWNSEDAYTQKSPDDDDYIVYGEVASSRRQSLRLLRKSEGEQNAKYALRKVSSRKTADVDSKKSLYMQSETSGISRQARQAKHTGIKQFTCKFCGLRWNSKVSLKSHIGKIHRGAHPYRCLMCKEEFTTSQAWNEHCKSHPNEEYDKYATGLKKRLLHGCTECDASFAYQSQLASHERSHSGSGPYVCNFCDRVFRNALSLKGHIAHHKGSKPYLCTLCQVRFSTKDDMTTHKKHEHEEGNESIDLDQTLMSDIVDDDSAAAHKLTQRNSASTSSKNNGGQTFHIECVLDSSAEDNEMRPHEIDRGETSNMHTERGNGKKPPFVSKGTTPGSPMHITRQPVGRSYSIEEKIAEICKALKVKQQLDSQSTHGESSSTKKRKEFDDTELQPIIVKKARKNADEASTSVAWRFDEQHPLDIDYSAGSTMDDTSERVHAEPSSVTDRSNTGELAVMGRKQYKRSSIAYVVEKNGKKNPNTLHVVWSEAFSLDLASAVSHYGSNCIMLVKNGPSFTVSDVTSLKFGLQTAAVNVGSVTEPLYWFDFGELNLPMNNSPFDSYAKVESKMRKFGRSKGMNVKMSISSDSQRTKTVGSVFS